MVELCCDLAGIWFTVVESFWGAIVRQLIPAYGTTFVAFMSESKTVAGVAPYFERIRTLSPASLAIPPGVRSFVIESPIVMVVGEGLVMFAYVLSATGLQLTDAVDRAIALQILGACFEQFRKLPYHQILLELMQFYMNKLTDSVCQLQFVQTSQPQ